MHPSYIRSSFVNDAALLKLREPVEFLPNVQPICLYDRDNTLIGRRVKATGWGHIYPNDRHSSALQEVN